MAIPLLNLSEKLHLVRQHMSESNLDAWLIIDFRGSDPTGPALLGELAPHSRSYAILITHSDPIVVIKSPVEADELIGLHPSLEVLDARTQSSFLEMIKQKTKGLKCIGLNYSENPQTDVLSAGRFAGLQKALPGIQYQSGENLMQIIHSVLTEEELAGHNRAALTLTNIMEQAFDYVKDRLGSVTEGQVADYLQEQLQQKELTSMEVPIVAVQANSSNPHYTTGNVIIKKNQLLMIDLWAKWEIFADITHMAYTGSKAPDEIQTVWDTIIEARHAATASIEPHIPARIPDEQARKIMIAAGFEHAILHRTGHSIDVRSHGRGANLDSYEMPETRLLLPNTLTSVEPGIYLKGRFGVRSEINVAVTKTGHRVTTPPQESLLCL